MVQYLFGLILSRCVRNARGREGRDYVWPSVTRRYGEVLSVNIYTRNTVGARYRSAEAGRQCLSSARSTLHQLGTKTDEGTISESEYLCLETETVII